MFREHVFILGCSKIGISYKVNKVILAHFLLTNLCIKCIIYE